jgi:hypothetical protein
VSGRRREHRGHQTDRDEKHRAEQPGGALPAQHGRRDEPQRCRQHAERAEQHEPGNAETAQQGTAPDPAVAHRGWKRASSRA